MLFPKVVIYLHRFRNKGKQSFGGVAERLNAPVLKTGMGDEPIGGSNPSSSASPKAAPKGGFFLARMQPLASRITFFDRHRDAPFRYVYPPFY